MSRAPLFSLERASAAWRKYGATAAVGLRDKLAYPASFAGSLLTYGLFIFIFSRIWATVYEGRASIAGYDRSMAVWYFIVAEIPMFGFGRFFHSLSRDMKSGQVAYLIARPYDFTGYHFAQAMGPALADSFVLAVEGAIIGLLVAGPFPVASPLHGFCLLLSLLTAGFLQFFLQFAIAMTAFWVEENAAFFWIYQKIALVAGTLMPLEFLPDIGRAIVRPTPFPYLAWAPARIAVAFDPSEAAAILSAQVAWTLAAALLCRAVFAAGSRKLSINGG
jgi:ABC-2 type transport system permease protein